MLCSIRKTFNAVSFYVLRHVYLTVAGCNLQYTLRIGNYYVNFCVVDSVHVGMRNRRRTCMCRRIPRADGYFVFPGEILGNVVY